MQNIHMSDKESIQRLPDDASLDVIAEQMEFLAGIRKGLDQIDRGETVSHEEVKRQLATWLTKQSGRSKPETI
jgi:predicted transcriptional regulator